MSKNCTYQNERTAMRNTHKKKKPFIKIEITFIECVECAYAWFLHSGPKFVFKKTTTTKNNL